MSVKIIELFKRLHSEDIQYCHWKSINRMEEVYKGLTDIDILVSISHAERFVKILSDFNAKSVLPRIWMIYPNMEDYLLYDDGKIFHFHIHYKLMMGKKNLKEYLLPLEELYLNNRVYNKEYDTFIVPSSLDIIMLLIRKIQKTSFSMSMKLFFSSIDYKNDDEITYLLEHITKKDFYTYLNQVDKKLHAEGSLYKIIDEIYKNNFIINYKQYKDIKNIISSYKIYNPLYNLLVPKIRKYLNYFVAFSSRNNAKHFKKSGLSIALVGADGSGKTTVADQLIKKLRYKLSAKKYYLGCNKRSYSVISKMLVSSSYLFRIFKKLNSKNNLFANLHFFGVLIAEYACLYDRRRLYLQSLKDIANGMIVVYERFPLKDTIDYPMNLDKNYFHIQKKMKFIEKFESYIKREYKKINLPKSTFWINAPVELISSRRKMNSNTIHKVSKKYELVSLFAHTNNLIILDAHNSVDILVKQIIKRIFKV